MYTRGLSTRDIEATLADDHGQTLVSRSGASRMSEVLYEEYERWSGRELSDFDVIYLFADGVYESIRSISGGQTILCVWGHMQRWAEGVAGIRGCCQRVSGLLGGTF